MVLDREKAVKTLESILNADVYDNWLSEEERQSVCDVLVLLKEPVEPISRFNRFLNEMVYWCGKCEAHIEKNQSYCGCCGRKVKWHE